MPIIIGIIGVVSGLFSLIWFMINSNKESRNRIQKRLENLDIVVSSLPDKVPKTPDLAPEELDLAPEELDIVPEEADIIPEELDKTLEEITYLPPSASEGISAYVAEPAFCYCSQGLSAFQRQSLKNYILNLPQSGNSERFLVEIDVPLENIRRNIETLSSEYEIQDKLDFIFRRSGVSFLMFNHILYNLAGSFIKSIFYSSGKLDFYELNYKKIGTEKLSKYKKQWKDAVPD